MRVPTIEGLWNEKRRILFGCFVAVSLLGLGWQVLRPHEPVFEGKPLELWLREAYPDGYYDFALAAPEAAQAISSIGADAVPTLLRMVSARDSIKRRILLGCAHEYPFLHLPVYPNEGELAVWAFKILGAKGKQAVPGLVALLEDKDPIVRFNAARVLGGIGVEAGQAVPAVAAALRRATGTGWQDAALRDAAAAALGEMGPAALPVLGELAALTNVPSAALAITKLKGESFISFFERLKDTSDARAWARTARVVAGLGTNAEPAVPLLLAGLTSTNRAVVEQALYALVRIQSRPDLCVPAAIKMLESDDPNNCYQSLILLGVFGEQARPAVPEILRLIDRSKQWEWVQRQATNALRAIDSETTAPMRGRLRTEP